MKKFIKIKKIILEKKLKKVTCDICQKTFNINTNYQAIPITTLKGTSPYGSKFDGTSIELDICDKCLEKLFNKECISFKTYYKKDLW